MNHVEATLCLFTVAVVTSFVLGAIFSSVCRNRDEQRRRDWLKRIEEEDEAP